MSNEIRIRRATVADVPHLVRLRRMMFEAMGYGNPAQLDAADAAAEAYFSAAIPSRNFFGWLAFATTGEAVSSGGVVIDRHPPGPANLSGQVGYIMNLVTDPRYRRQGIARRMMHHVVEWLAEQGIQTMALHATDMGRPLYEELGFENSTEMRLILGT